MKLHVTTWNDERSPAAEGIFIFLRVVSPSYSHDHQTLFSLQYHPIVSFSERDLGMQKESAPLFGRGRERTHGSQWSGRTSLEMGPERLVAIGWMEGIFYKETNGQVMFGDHLGKYLTIAAETQCFY